MISVCIPVYNEDVRLLADNLARQVEELEIPVEIMVFDDASEEKWRAKNQVLKGMAGITYRELPENRGRAAIRNYLGKASSGAWLLFLDADSGIVDDNFLHSYLEVIDKGDVICGGTLYQEAPPPDSQMLLRWAYGRKREQLTALQRNQGNKFAITANNFMIRRDMFLEHPFRETILNYGHEDTVLGYDLITAGARIVHIDNPVWHTGLEPSADYLEKTKVALDNLIFISENIVPDRCFVSGLKLIQNRNRLKRLGLISLAGFLYSRLKPLLERNLTGSDPSLLLFDLYRMGYLCTKK